MIGQDSKFFVYEVGTYLAGDLKKNIYIKITFVKLDNIYNTYVILFRLLFKKTLQWSFSIVIH